MSIADSTDVYDRSGVSTSEITSTQMTNIIAMADIDVQNIVQSEFYYSEFFQNQGDERVIVMNDVSTVSDFIKVEIDGDEIFEEDKNELMDNGDVEEVDDDATGDVEDWETASGTSATYTHSSTAYTGRKSLLITSGAQETAYWQTTDSIEVQYPQDSRLPAFRFTYYLKTASVVAGTGNGAYVKILWYNSSDTLLATDDDSSTAVTDTADWAKKTITKYAPDTASYVVIQCVHDGSSGTAYFDTMKFRRVNWVDKAPTATIDLLRTYPNEFMAFWYSKTDTVNPLVQQLANDIAAKMCLLKVAGGSSSGLSYKVDTFQVNKSRLSAERVKLISQLTMDIEDKINRLREQGLLKDNKEDWAIGKASV